MIPGVGPYSALFTPKAGSLFHAVFQPDQQSALVPGARKHAHENVRRGVYAFGLLHSRGTPGIRALVKPTAGRARLQHSRPASRERPRDCGASGRVRRGSF